MHMQELSMSYSKLLYLDLSMRYELTADSRDPSGWCVAWSYLAI